MAVKEGYNPNKVDSSGQPLRPTETKEENDAKVASRGRCVDWMIWLVMTHLWIELITKSWKLISVWFIKNTVSAILKVNGTSIECAPIYLKERYTMIPSVMA